jgi:hypothetical protein
LALGAPIAVAEENGASVAARTLQLEPAPAAAVSRIARRGVFVVVVKVAVPHPLAEVRVTPSISTIDGSYRNLASRGEKVVKITDGKAAVSFRMPYAWLVASANEMVTVEAVVTADVSSERKYLLSYTATLGKEVPLPSDGATTVVNVSGSM